eukprot:364432-Chlamydomonas_euryale.AAC.4
MQAGYFRATSSMTIQRLGLKSSLDDALNSKTKDRNVTITCKQPQPLMLTNSQTRQPRTDMQRNPAHTWHSHTGIIARSCLATEQIHAGTAWHAHTKQCQRHHNACRPAPDPRNARLRAVHQQLVQRQEPAWAVVPTGRIHNLVPTGRIHNLVPTGRIHNLVPTGCIHDLESPGTASHRTLAAGTATEPALSLFAQPQLQFCAALAVHLRSTQMTVSSLRSTRCAPVQRSDDNLLDLGLAYVAHRRARVGRLERRKAAVRLRDAERLGDVRVGPRLRRRLHI